jgi:nucleotide-binding universal stress UspA family protein
MSSTGAAGPAAARPQLDAAPARRRRPSMIRRIMHATDFSPASRAAFAKAVEMTKVNRATLFVVHVLGAVVPLMADGYVAPGVYDALAASSRAWGQKQLARLVARARASGVRARGLLLEGVPHERIVRAARSNRVDLLVLGTHGRSGLAKLVTGSVAGRVVAAARCPVLTVRGR